MALITSVVRLSSMLWMTALAVQTTACVRKVDVADDTKAEADVRASNFTNRDKFAVLDEKVDKKLKDKKFKKWLEDMTDFKASDENEDSSVHSLHPGPGCEVATSDYIKITIWSDVKSRKLKKSDVTENGGVLAKIHNPHQRCSTNTTEGFVLKPMQTVYWIVYKEGGTLRSRYVEETEKRPEDLPASTNFIICDGSDHKPDNGNSWRKSKAEFRADEAGGPACGFKIHRDDFHLDVLRAHNSSPWVRCETGCCIAADS